MGQNTEKEKAEKQIQAAEEILNRLIRNITAEYPIFGFASECFTLVPVREEIFFETDTKYIYYSPEVVLKCVAKKKMDELKYGYMHILCHGLLNHFTIGEDYSRKPMMHRLMDMEVFLMLEELKVRRRIVRELFEDTPILYDEINLMRKGCSLMKAYRNISRSADNRQNLMKSLMESAVYTAVDHHEIWMCDRQFRLLKAPQESGAGEMPLKDVREFFFEDGASLAERVKTVVQNTSAYGRAASDAGKMTSGENSNGNEAEFDTDRKTQLDYTEVLRRFLKIREMSRENPESIDKALYSLGFQMYGNIPLVEPEEETEYKCLGTVVLAIDTSGSCWGEPLRQFLAETRGIFKGLGSIQFDRFVILQCDERIWKEDSYRSVREFPDFNEETVKCYGSGGTSFVPVFDRISEMQQNGEKVECLIYLSDAIGEFPEKEPENYETFFVIPQTAYEDEESAWIKNMRPKWVHYLKLNII